jgi:signal transduction histidine kinase
MALKLVPPGSLEAECLADAAAATHRAAEFTSQMLDFTANGPTALTDVDINEVVEETARFVRAAWQRPRQIVFELHPRGPLFRGDQRQVRRVVMNLLMNASEAIPADVGVITVATGQMEVDRGFLAECYQASELDPGPYIYLDVRDSGAGMTAEMRRRIFDPFFTTKPTGHGLGLAAVFGIARGHGGTVRVRSVPGKGTVVTVLFPVRQRQSTSGNDDPGRSATKLEKGPE